MVYTEHPNGFAHTRSSIRKVAELARAGQESFAIVNLARRIVHDVPGKAYDDELRALYIWVREHVRYRKDPVGLEWLQAPHVTVAQRAGDCDDLAGLLAALVGALGHLWRLITVGSSPTSQGHIAVQASTDGGATWVTLDPVMEPRQPTTALRTDVGAYGRTPRAPSVRLWDQRGEAMALGSYPDAALRSLWQWQPYFPMGPYAVLPKRGTAHLQYRSADAPGAPSAIMSGGYLGALGDNALLAGLAGCCQLGTPTALYLVDGAVDTSRMDGMGGYPYRLGSIWGSIKKIGKGVAHAASGAVRAVGKVAKAVVKSPVGKVAAPVLALNVDPKLKAIRNAALKNIPGGGALLKVGTTAEHVAAQVAKKGSAAGRKPVGTFPAGVVKPVKRTGGLSRALSTRQTTIVKRIVAPAAKAATSADDWKKPHPAIAQRYPRNARQTYDKQAGVFRVYAPRGTLSGRMGALVPTLTLSLGAASSSPASVAAFNAQQRARAQVAVAAVQQFMKSRADHRAPGKALPEVLALQQADAQRPGGGVALKADGLWGNNTRAAAAYYLGTSVTALPANLPALTTALTWSPPTASAAPALQPAAAAPAAVVVRPPAAAPASSSAPAGYVEVGHETQNPGLPPVGAPTAAGPAAPVSSSPLQVPVTSSVPAIPVRPEPVPGFQPPGSVTYLPPPAPSSSPAPMAPGAPTLVIHAPPPQPTFPAVASPPGGAPTLPPPPLPAGPGYAPGPVLERSSAGSGGKSGSMLPWLALAYCMSRK